MAETDTNKTPERELTDTEKLVQEAMAEAQSQLNDLKEQAEAAPVRLPDFASGGSGQSMTSLDLLSDVELHVTVELGRTQMLVEDVLKLGEGSVVELDKLAGDPVDVYVNNRLIARGEVLVLNDNFCIRISEIVADLEEQAEAAAEQAVGSSR